MGPDCANPIICIAWTNRIDPQNDLSRTGLWISEPARFKHDFRDFNTTERNSLAVFKSFGNLYRVMLLSCFVLEHPPTTQRKTISVRKKSHRASMLQTVSRDIDSASDVSNFFAGNLIRRLISNGNMRCARRCAIFTHLYTFY